MKILVVSQYYTPEPFRISDICEVLVEMGHEVTVLTGLPNYPEGEVLSEYKLGSKRREIIRNVEVIRSFEIGRGNSNLKLFLNYISFMVSSSVKVMFLKKDYDVILINQLSPILMAVPGIIYKMKNRKKLVLYCLDLWPESLVAGGIKKGSIIYKFFKIISTYIYKQADQILISSNSFKKYFDNVLAIETNNMNYLPQYAEDLFLEVEDNTINGHHNFVFAGNIGEMQSVETIIRAANLLKQFKNIQFHIIGDGSNLNACQKLANEMELSNITFYGRKPVEEMPTYYAIADAMLVTLKNNDMISYTLPGKVPTYMAAKKPIIGAINGETKYVINEAQCGLCCLPEDYKSLAEIIKEFCFFKDKKQMGLNGQKYYEQYFDKNNFMDKLEKVLIKQGS